MNFLLLGLCGFTTALLVRVDPSGKFMVTCDAEHLLIGSALQFTQFQSIPRPPSESCFELIWSHNGDEITVISNQSEAFVYFFPNMTPQYRIPGLPIWRPDGSMFVHQTAFVLRGIAKTAPLWSVSVNRSTDAIWSPDGLTLAAPCSNGTLFLLWGVNGTVRQAFQYATLISSCSWISNTVLLVTDGRRLSIVDTVFGKLDLLAFSCDTYGCERLKRSGSLILVGKYYAYDAFSLHSSSQFLPIAIDYADPACSLDSFSNDQTIAICRSTTQELQGNGTISQDIALVGVLEARGRSFPFPQDMGAGRVQLTWRPASTLLALFAGTDELQDHSGLVLLDIPSGVSTEVKSCSVPTFNPTGNFLAMICSLPPSTRLLRVLNMTHQASILHREWVIDDVTLNLAWISDERLITVSSSDQPTLTVWDTAQGNITKQLVPPDKMTLVASFPGDGNFIVATANSTLQLWSFASSKLTKTRTIQTPLLREQEIKALTVSSKGYVAVASKTLLIIWDGMNGEIIYMHNFSTSNCSGTYTSLSWAFDNATLACSCDDQILIWRSGPGRYNQVFFKDTMVYSVAWRGKLPFQLAYSTAQGVTLWQPPDVIKRKDGLTFRGTKGLKVEIEGEFLDTTGPRPHGGILFGYDRGPAEWVERGTKVRSLQPPVIRERRVKIGWVTEGKQISEQVLLPAEGIYTWDNLCEQGYGFTEAGCVQCPNNPGLKVVGGAAAFLALTMLQSYLAIRKQSSSFRNSQILGLLTSTIQLHALSMATDLGFKRIRNDLLAVSVPLSTQGGFFSFASTHCVLVGISIERVQRTKLMLIIITPVLVYLGSRMLLCVIRRPSHKLNVVLGVYAWSNLNSVLIMAQLKSLICLPPVDGNLKVTVLDPLEICNQPSYILWVVFGVAPGFLYLLIPVYAAMKRGENNCLEFLVAKYKKRGWVVIHHFRNPGLATIFLVSQQNAIWQWSLLWLGLHFVATFLTNPYNSKFLMTLEAASIVSGLFLMLKVHYKDGGWFDAFAIPFCLLFYLLALLWVNCCSSSRKVLPVVASVSLADPMNSTDSDDSNPLLSRKSL